MFGLRESIFATIVYYDVFNFPLTFAEIYKYLINPEKFSGKNGGVTVELSDMANELDKMIKAGIIGHKNGFYFLPGNTELYENRIEKDKLANVKWKKFLRIVGRLQSAPYLRAVFASGSLAVNNLEPKSDFDVFVVIKTGRLYTGRLFLWLISSLWGVRRGRFDVVAPDKLCFNHYVTDDNLELSRRSLYVAQSVANMKPVMASGAVLGSFLSANKWVSRYCYNFRPVDKYRGIKPSKFMVAAANLGEFILDTKLGDLLEKVFRIVQQKRIKNNPATYESGGRIVFTDRELEFHPRSFERIVIDSYNDKMKKAGILNCLEKNSGLN